MKHSLITFLGLSIFLLSASILLAAESVKVLITDFGAKPGSRENTFPAVEKAIHVCRAESQNGARAVSLVFPKGEYHFFNPEGRDRVFGLWIDGLKNFTIEGEGSRFIYHGTMGICYFKNGENVTARNFSVDWEKPFIAQGTVLETADAFMDVRFDAKEYPYEIVDGKLLFLGEGWKRQIEGYTLLFDKKTRDLVYRTRDGAVGGNAFFNDKPEDRGNGVIRFHGKPNYKPEPGTYIALWLGRYIQNGIQLDRCRNVVLENITLYHGLSHGVYAFRTENLTLKKVDYLTNEEKDRVFSLVADGYHLDTCKGLVKIENCTQIGMGDDFLNLHGRNVLVEKRIDDHTLAVRFAGRGGAVYVFEAGDEAWFLNGKTMQRESSNRIREIKDIREGDKVVAKHVVFEDPLPENVGEGTVLENKTWNAELEMRGCKVLRKHRARGILVTTPKRAVIEGNYFATAGTAILVEGDTNYWFESGACTDMLIKNNVFDNCFSSGYSGDWGHAVITIHPSFQPRDDQAAAYHRGIRIENNTFKVFDYPLVFARSVADLRFTGNKIELSKTYVPFAINKATFWLDGCRDVVISANRYDDGILGKNAKIFHMKEGDVKIEDTAIRLEK